MTPHYTDDWLTVYHGDARAVMAEMPPESVHMVCTSPPYWGLRDYGTAAWDGGDPDCDHVELRGSTRGGPASTITGGIDTTAHNGQYRHTCGKCGAIRQDGQLGLEPTPEAYVESMVAVFREVRRVLRSDGTVWLNLGDSYAGSWGNQGRKPERGTQRPINGGMIQSFDGYPQKESNTGDVPPGLKPKDLVGIPWRVAFALQADGWYLRSDIIWSKNNPMPESVTDRPTKSHEYLFLLSKSPRYYFDADAVREAVDFDELHRRWGGTLDRGWPDEMGGRGSSSSGATGRSAQMGVNPAGRNLRSVWTIATAPYPGAHFATFPPKLVEPCIKAGCPPDGVVLDPFAGSGTTGLVAQRLSRRAILIDLSMDYLGQLMERNRDVPLGI